MPKEYSRTQRVGDMLHRELSQLIAQNLSDPRLSRVTVASVNISPDLANAKVFITLLDDESKIEETLKILNKASGHLRRALAKNVELRIIPRLQFVYDKSISYSSKLSALINEIPITDADKDSE